MAQLLSASSVMVAVLALVYSQWYPEITRAIARGTQAKTQPAADRTKAFKEVQQVLSTRAMPLVLATLLLVLTTLKDALKIIVSSACVYHENGLLQTFLNYDAVSTMYVIIVLLTVAFWIHLVMVACEARQLKKALKPKS